MRMLAISTLALALALGAAGCGGGGDTSPAPTPSPTPAPTPTPTTTVAVSKTPVASFDNPWAMVFLPDGRLLVTEKSGPLRIVTQQGGVGSAVSGTPAVVDSGQGGLLDVTLDPAFATNRVVYLSYAEAGAGGAGLAVMRATLTANADNSGALSDASVIWRQFPKIANESRHYGGRLAFGPDGKLYITAGERHQGAPAQLFENGLGKVIRINSDGSVPDDNPFPDYSGAAVRRSDIWTLGHRNPYGLVFGTDGKLYESEMGPDQGDEFNIIAGGANYGWRVVSEGSDGGETLPKHSTHPEFAAPAYFWTSNIAPSGMIQYVGTRFIGWDRDFLLGGLVSQGIVRVRVRVTGNTATEVARISLGARIREVELGPDGNIWVLEDGSGGRLIRLDPA